MGWRSTGEHLGRVRVRSLHLIGKAVERREDLKQGARLDRLCVVQVLGYVFESSMQSIKGIPVALTCTGFYSPCHFSDL